MQSILFDGRTGEPFDQDVTVGVMYMLKLHHLVDEKIHALHRALLARHPAAARRQGAVRRPAPRRDGGLGDGGLRRGLLAAGVPDGEVRRRGRRMYEAIVKGENTLESGLPVAFNVLIKELQSLALDVELPRDPRGEGGARERRATSADRSAPRGAAAEKKTA